jgi:hypothetical protein
MVEVDQEGAGEMSTVDHRIAVTTAARRMFEEAKSQARQFAIDDPDRSFYYGVETAALHALHPAAQAVWGEDHRWLDAESAGFRDGYLTAMAALNAAETASTPPLRVPLPQP